MIAPAIATGEPIMGFVSLQEDIQDAKDDARAQRPSGQEGTTTPTTDKHKEIVHCRHCGEPFYYYACLPHELQCKGTAFSLKRSITDSKAIRVERRSTIRTQQSRGKSRKKKVVVPLSSSGRNTPADPRSARTAKMKPAHIHCRICNCSLKKKSLIRHMRRVHRVVYCHVCQIFMTPTTLQNHRHQNRRKVG